MRLWSGFDNGEIQRHPLKNRIYFWIPTTRKCDVSITYLIAIKDQRF